jgi:molybdopterin-guanine dinucleotide biosynthesis protein A
VNVELAGVVLAGGAARRLSGVDKPMLEIRGRPILHAVVDALSDADPVVVVGPRRAGPQGVLWTRERPVGGGPVAALAAGLARVPGGARLVAVLAGDLPAVTRSTVDRLRAAIDTADGAVLLDDSGRKQWLAGVWRHERLRAALPEAPAGRSLRSVFGGLEVTGVIAVGDEALDVDTPEDVDRLR